MDTMWIITGHGSYASGIKNALCMLVGESPRLHFVDFQAQDTDETLREHYQALLTKRAGAAVLFVCDLLGGTPFKVAKELSCKAAGIEVVAGANIGGVLEVLFQENNWEVKELARQLMAASRRAIGQDVF